MDKNYTIESSVLEIHLWLFWVTDCENICAYAMLFFWENSWS